MCSGTLLARDWHSSGLVLVQFQHGSDTVSAWFWPRIDTVPAWDCHGSGLGYVSRMYYIDRYKLGLYVDREMFRM